MSSAPPEPGTDPKAGSGPADGLSSTGGLSATVRGAVDDLGSDAVPASALIEAILQRHRGDYLRGAELGERVWPVDEVRQPARSWIRELVRVLLPDPDRGIFGRIAVAGLCLLDPQVAQVAQSSGLLYAVALEVGPDLVSFLSDEGLRLLRVRTPMVAWGLRALEPGVQPLLHGEAGTPCLALDDHARLAPGRVGRWALSWQGDVLVASGAITTHTLSGLGSMALGWVDGALAGFLAEASDNGLFVWTPASNTVLYPGGWSVASAGAITARSLAAVSPGGQVQWNRTTSPPEGSAHPSRPARQVAARTGAVALLAGDELLVAPDGSGLGFVPISLSSGVHESVAVTQDAVFTGSADGRVAAYARDATGVGGPCQALTDGPVALLEAGAHLLVAASEREVALLNGSPVASGQQSRANVIARWLLPPDSPPIVAVALSEDDAALGVVTAAGVRIWRIDSPSEHKLTSYSSDAPEGEDLLAIGSAVNALAALVAAKVVRPPVSIGLFGAWGSGKSFFMRALERRVALLTAEARNSGRDQSSLWAWRNISQISFNAWNYSSADVWAGMIEQLIRQLARPAEGRLTLPPELENLRARREIRLVSAQQTRAEATTKLALAETRLSEAKEQVKRASGELLPGSTSAESDREAGIRGGAAQEAREGLDAALEKAGLAPAATSLAQVWSDITAARAAAASAAGLVRSGEALWLVLAALAGPIIGIAAAIVATVWQPQLTAVGAVLGAVLGWAAPLTGWLRDALGKVDTQLKALAEAEVQARSVETALVRERDAAARELAAAEEEVAQSPPPSPRRARRMDRSASWSIAPASPTRPRRSAATRKPRRRRPIRSSSSSWPSRST